MDFSFFSLLYCLLRILTSAGLSASIARKNFYLHITDGSFAFCCLLVEPSFLKTFVCVCVRACCICVGGGGYTFMIDYFDETC